MRRILVLAAMIGVGGCAAAQTCTTQAKMLPATRDAIAQAAFDLASAVKSGDGAKVQASSAADLAGSFSATSYLVRTTGDAVASGSLKVTQVYELDANARKAGDTSEADFACPLTGSSSETDFGINGLTAGLYAFAVVESAGDKPWVMSFLLKQESGAWKMAGFYPHARAVAGRDGLWFWNAAREADHAKKPWLAWVLYGEADVLLRPANFVASTHLDKLRSERGTVVAAIPELRDGFGVDVPLVLKGADGTPFAFTTIAAEGSESGQQLRLVLRYKAEALTDVGAAKARNVAAAKAVVGAHPELKTGFDAVWVWADVEGQPPVLTQLKPSEL